MTKRKICTGSVEGHEQSDRDSSCPSCHRNEELKAELESQQLDLLKQCEQLNAELDNVKADNNRNLSKIEFLRLQRNCNEGDVILALNSDSRISAHRAILAKRSPLFQRLLRSERPLITLDCLLSGPVLEATVNFCYCGEIVFSEFVPAQDVLRAAYMFQLGFLSDLAEAELCRGLAINNVFKMMKLARDYSARQLQEEARKLFNENFEILIDRFYEVMEEPHDSLTGHASKINDVSGTHAMNGGTSVQRAESPSTVKENHPEGHFRDKTSPTKSKSTFFTDRSTSPRVPYRSQSVKVEEDHVPPVPGPSLAPIAPSGTDFEEETYSEEDILQVTVPDPDFHDFDKYRTEEDILPGQVWAIHDDQDGMPRIYGRVARVFTKTFRVHINWLDHSASSDSKRARAIISGLSIACGEFKIGKPDVIYEIKSFSHHVMETKGKGKGMLKINPNKGQVWAVYSNWDIDSDGVLKMCFDPPTYDMVEILSEFSEETSLQARLLLKVPGFTTVFSRAEGMEAIRHFNPRELGTFSHSVPNQVIDDKIVDEFGLPRGALQLDPASTPFKFLFTNPSDPSK